MYSSEYISDLLLLDDMNREKLKGIKATFGEIDVGIEKNIKELEERLIPKEKIQAVIAENGNLEELTKDEIEKIFGERKGNLGIKNKPRSLSVFDIVDKYSLDYDDALKIEPEKDKIKHTIGDDNIEKKIMLLNEILIPEPIIKEKSFYSKLEDYQNKTYTDIQIPHSIVIKWLSEGVKIHENKEKCEFCGSPINYKDIEKKVESFVNNVKFEAEIFFKNEHQFFVKVLEDFNAFIQNKDKYEELLGNNLSYYINQIKGELDYFENLNNALYNNSQNITSLTPINTKELESLIDFLNKLIVDINKIKAKVMSQEEKKLSKLGTIIKGSVYIAINESVLIKRNMDKIKNNQQFILKSEKLNETLSNEIKKLKSEKAVTSDFMILVNETLRDLGITLKLEIEDENYIIKTTLATEEQITINDISEGEKNLISLLFFYYEMFEDRNQQVVKSDVKLIIMDDPISSMDDSNRFYVLEIVKNIIELNVDQVFVLTHVWEDFSQLTFRKKGFDSNSKYASYEIKKDKFSYIVKLISKGGPYKHMFKEVYELSKKTQLSTDCEYFHMPNVIRRVFEEFLLFKTYNMIPQRKTKEHLEQIFKITKTIDKCDLGTLLSVTNALSHINTKTNDDILIAAKCLMKIIKNNDKLHYDTMKQ